MSSHQFIDEMLIALKANIEYLQSEGNQQIKITNGIYLKPLADFHIYRFDIPPLKEVDLDQDIEVRVNFATVSGRVIASSNDQIEIQLEKFIGDNIAEAFLVVSSYYLLQKLFDKLTEINEGRLKVADTAEKLFGIQEFTSSKDSLYDIPLITRNNLDEDKVEALKLCLGSDVSFIWGPPGTGKTQLIAALIEALTSRNQSVLLLSHTNKATDGALLRTVKHFKHIDSSIFKEGKILRIGKIFDDKLRAYEELTPEYAIKLKSKPLIDAVEKLSSAISEDEEKLSKAKEIQSKCEKLGRLEKLYEEAKIELDTSNARNKELKESISSAKSEIKKTEENIGKYNKSNFFGRLFSGLDLETLTRKKGELIVKLEHYQNLVNELIKKREYAEGVKSDTEEQIKILKEEIGDIDYASFEREIDALSVTLKTKLKERDLLLKQIDELSITIIKEALVIGTTLTKSYTSKIVLSRPYDCVIIDEASMAPMPAVWCAAGLANKSIAIVGDFLQLSPITQYRPLKDKHKTESELQIEAECVDRWLKKDIFRQLNIVEGIKEGVDMIFLKQLTWQYRMHPDIADLINTLIYGTYGSQYTLKSGDKTRENGKDTLSKKPLPNYHIGLINTNDIGTMSIKTESGSRYNIYHALVAVQLAKEAIKNGYKEIGIISPFRAQTNLIKMILKDLSKELPEAQEIVMADTVHKYQGDEKQIVIFDTVTADPTKLTDDNENHGGDEQLMNVAFSRAKEKCIVIADVEKIEQKHSESSVLKKFVEFCRGKRYPILTSKGLFKGYETGTEEEEWLKKLNSSKLQKEFLQSELFDQSSFYKAFINDLLKAEKEVIIVSPYLTHERMQTFFPIFNFLIRKQIKIFVITRPTRLQEGSLKQQSGEIIKQLEEIGVIVLPLIVPVHEKLAIIDRKILWEGSLNILSQRNSSEIMRRFVGSESCKQLLSFLWFDKNIGKIDENKLIRCEYCKEAGAWYWTDKGMYGYWTHCLVGNHRIGKEPATEEERQEKKSHLHSLRKQKKEYTQEGVPICPEHNVQMIKKKGKWGKDFWGCPKFPRCRITESIK